MHLKNINILDTSDKQCMLVISCSSISQNGALVKPLGTRVWIQNQTWSRWYSRPWESIIARPDMRTTLMLSETSKYLFRLFSSRAELRLPTEARISQMDVGIHQTSYGPRTTCGAGQKEKLPALPWKWDWAVPAVRYQSSFFSNSGKSRRQKTRSPTTCIA